jgi:hypothetical protein
MLRTLRNLTVSALILTAPLWLTPRALADGPTNPGGGQDPPDGDPVALVVGHGVDLVTRVISVLPTIYAL